jgi:hypothetical protein
MEELPGETVPFGRLQLRRVSQEERRPVEAPLGPAPTAAHGRGSEKGASIPKRLPGRER